MKNYTKSYFSLIFSVLIVFISLANAQKKITANPTAQQIKQISSDVFLKSGHRKITNSLQLYLYLKPDSSADYNYYRLQSGTPAYLQVVNKNGAMKPIRIMATQAMSAEPKYLGQIGITFLAMQERDDFIAELNIKASDPSKSGNTQSSGNTSKNISEVFQKEGR